MYGSSRSSFSHLEKYKYLVIYLYFLENNDANFLFVARVTIFRVKNNVTVNKIYSAFIKLFNFIFFISKTPFGDDVILNEKFSE
jgi:hypothetical protein